MRALTSLTVQCFPPSFATDGIKGGLFEVSSIAVGLPASGRIGERHRYVLPALGRVGSGSGRDGEREKFC